MRSSVKDVVRDAASLLPLAPADLAAFIDEQPSQVALLGLLRAALVDVVFAHEEEALALLAEVAGEEDGVEAAADAAAAGARARAHARAGMRGQGRARHGTSA